MEKLSRNFLWMAAANLIASVFTALIFIYLARTLRPQSFGYISFAQTIVSYLANFLDLGLVTYGIREVARHREKVSEYVSDIVSFKFYAACIICFISIAFIFTTGHSALLKVLLVESCLLIFLFVFATEWAFQGMEAMHMVFISFAVTTALQFILVLLFIKGPQDLLKIPLLYAIASIPILTIFLRRLGFNLRFTALNLVRIKGYLSSSLIIWSISLFAQVYNNLDVVILGFFRGVTEVGYYAVARRVVGGGAVVMILLANAVLPRLSSAYRSNMAEFNSSIRRFLKVAVILTLLVFVPLIITSRQLVSFIFGNAYIQASLPLSIMIAGLVLVLFNLPFSTGLIAACFEKDVLAQAAICAFLNVGMNLAFMPKYGMTGAAVSFLVTEAAALLLVVAMYRKRMRVLEADMVSETGKTGKGER